MMWFPCFQMLPGQCTSSTAECRLDDAHNTDALARGLGPAYNGRIEHDWWRCDPTPTIQSMHKLWSIFFSKPQTRSNPEICDQSCYAAIVWGQVCQPLWLDSAACHADGRWTWLYDIATIVVMKQGYFMNSMTCMLGRLGRVEISWGRVGENFAESWQKD